MKSAFSPFSIIKKRKQTNSTDVYILCVSKAKISKELHGISPTPTYLSSTATAARPSAAAAAAAAHCSKQAFAVASASMDPP